MENSIVRRLTNYMARDPPSATSSFGFWENDAGEAGCGVMTRKFRASLPFTTLLAQEHVKKEGSSSWAWGLWTVKSGETRIVSTQILWYEYIRSQEYDYYLRIPIRFAKRYHLAVRRSSERFLRSTYLNWHHQPTMRHGGLRIYAKDSWS